MQNRYIWSCIVKTMNLQTYKLAMIMIQQRFLSNLNALVRQQEHVNHVQERSNQQ